METLSLVSFGGGGGGTPGGSSTQIQYNDNGSLAGSPDFTWDQATQTLTVNGTAVISDGTY